MSGSRTRAPPRAPRSTATRRSVSRMRSASRTVGRATANSLSSSVSFGSGLPGRSSPRAICARIASAISSAALGMRTRAAMRPRRAPATVRDHLRTTRGAGSAGLFASFGFCTRSSLDRIRSNRIIRYELIKRRADLKEAAQHKRTERRDRFQGETADHLRGLARPRAAAPLDRRTCRRSSTTRCRGSCPTARAARRGSSRPTCRRRRSASTPRPGASTRTSAGPASPSPPPTRATSAATPRLEEQDVDGVDAEVLFGSARMMSHFFSDPDPEFQLAGVQAYNNWLARGDREGRARPPDRPRRHAGARRRGGDPARWSAACKLGMRGVWLNTMPSVGADDPPRGRPVLGRGAGERRAGPLPRPRDAADPEAQAEGRARRRPDRPRHRRRRRHDHRHGARSSARASTIASRTSSGWRSRRAPAGSPTSSSSSTTAGGATARGCR